MAKLPSLKADMQDIFEHGHRKVETYTDPFNGKEYRTITITTETGKYSFPEIYDYDDGAPITSEDYFLKRAAKGFPSSLNTKLDDDRIKCKTRIVNYLMEHAAEWHEINDASRYSKPSESKVWQIKESMKKLRGKARKAMESTLIEEQTKYACLYSVYLQNTRAGREYSEFLAKQKELTPKAYSDYLVQEAEEMFERIQDQKYKPKRTIEYVGSLFMFI